MFASLRDCVPLIKWTRHLESPQDLLTMFDEEVEGYLKDKVLDPLCRAVEEDLRLSSHLHLQLDDRNPYKVLLAYVFDVLPKLNPNYSLSWPCSHIKVFSHFPIFISKKIYLYWRLILGWYVCWKQQCITSSIALGSSFSHFSVAYLKCWEANKYVFE